MTETIGTFPSPIPASERLPELKAEALFCNATAGWFAGMYVGDGKFCAYFDKEFEEFTHWLPLPPKP